MSVRLYICGERFKHKVVDAYNLHYHNCTFLDCTIKINHRSEFSDCYIIGNWIKVIQDPDEPDVYVSVCQGQDLNNTVQNNSVEYLYHKGDQELDEVSHEGMIQRYDGSWGWL